MIVQISDPHHTGEPEPAGALAAAVAAIGRLEPAPDAVLLTGDIANSADPAEYAQVRELLAPLAMPVHPLPGNHDDRDALREAFADHAQLAATSGFVQYAVSAGDVRLVLCDTTEPGEEGGRLDEERLAWLEAELGREPDTPTLLAMHHPPILTGMPVFDAIGLPPGDRERLAEIVGAAAQVRLLVTGHVHRAIAGTLAGRPVFVCPSVHLQAKLDLRPQGELALFPAPPAFGVHLLAEGDAVSHVEPVVS